MASLSHADELFTLRKGNPVAEGLQWRSVTERISSGTRAAGGVSWQSSGTRVPEGFRAMNVRGLFDPTGRVAIITGGSIGLGRQVAEGFRKWGRTA